MERRLVENFHYKCVVNLDILSYVGTLRSLVEFTVDNRCEFTHGDIGGQKFSLQLVQENQVGYIVDFGVENHVDRLRGL